MKTKQSTRKVGKVSFVTDTAIAPVIAPPGYRVAYLEEKTMKAWEVPIAAFMRVRFGDQEPGWFAAVMSVHGQLVPAGYEPGAGDYIEFLDPRETIEHAFPTAKKIE